jgi:hypothetical protein
MHLVFFEEALVLVCRLCRLFLLEQQHIVLQGIVGSGRTSLTRLAAFTCGFECVEPPWNSVHSLGTDSSGDTTLDGDHGAGLPPRKNQQERLFGIFATSLKQRYTRGCFVLAYFC